MISHIGGQYKPLREDRIGRIHESSLRVLEETGVRVKNPEAIETFSRAGAKIDTDESIVRLPARLVEKTLKDAPAEIRLCGRDPSSDLVLGGSNVHMGTGGAALHVIDPETDQVRSGTLRDIADLARLVDRLDNVHFFIRPCSAQDIPAEDLGINEFYAALTNTSKHVMGTGYTIEGTRSVLDMAAQIAGGHDQLVQRPFISFTLGWMNSPLTFDTDLTDVLIEILNQKIPVALSSAPMAGATAPITMAGVLTQLHAEELAGITFCQLVQPGAPVLYGGIPGMADMRDLSFKAGGVEFGLMNAAISQLATYIGVPNYCSAGITEARIPSMQAIYEKTFSICQCALAGANFIHHAAGVLESLLTVEYGQFVIDNEIIGMALKMIQGIDVDEEHLAVKEIADAGPGGNYLSSEHTLTHLRTEFLEPMLVPREKRPESESLHEHEHLSVLQHARKKASEIIQSHQPMALPQEADPKLHRKFRIHL